MEQVNFSKCVKCIDCPCLDVNKECYIVPSIEVDPAKSKAFMVSEAHPKDPNEYFYAKGDARAVVSNIIISSICISFTIAYTHFF